MTLEMWDTVRALPPTPQTTAPPKRERERERDRQRKWEREKSGAREERGKGRGREERGERVTVVHSDSEPKLTNRNRFEQSMPITVSDEW